MSSVEKFLVKHRLKFQNSQNREQQLMPGDIVSFEEGDQIDVPMALKTMSIEPYEEPVPSNPELTEEGDGS